MTRKQVAAVVLTIVVVVVVLFASGSISVWVSLR
jgi:hypothetical protein